MSPKSATIVLVGLCNEEPLLQTLIGTIVFREGDGSQLEPRLINVQIGEDEGTPKNPFKPDFKWKKKGQYGFSFPVGSGHGVMIMLDAEKQKYDFTTGINHGDSGSSGPISHGGPELASVLDTLFE
jgi:hypothetical protein